MTVLSCKLPNPRTHSRSNKLHHHVSLYLEEFDWGSDQKMVACALSLCLSSTLQIAANTNDRLSRGIHDMSYNDDFMQRKETIGTQTQEGWVYQARVSGLTSLRTVTYDQNHCHESYPLADAITTLNSLLLHLPPPHLAEPVLT